jgi:hypothetical protein
MIRAVPCVIAALLLSACASHVDYPSLARRDAERITGTAPEPGALPPPPAPLPPPDAATKSRLDELVQQAKAAHGRFENQRSRTDQVVGRASSSAKGSENWAVASIALAELESVHSEAMMVLTSLDEIHAKDVLAHYNTPSGDAPYIAAARDQVQTWIGEEDRALDAMRGRLAS